MPSLVDASTMRVVFSSPKSDPGGRRRCNKVPDRQAVNRPDDYFIGHRRRGSGAYCPSVNFLNFPLNHIGDGWQLLSSPACSLPLLGFDSSIGEMRDCGRPPAALPQPLGRCWDARPSLHIGIIIAYIPTFPLKMWETLELGTGNNCSQMQSCCTEDNSALIWDFLTKHFFSKISAKNFGTHSILLLRPLMVCRWVEGRSGRRSKRISLAGFNSDEADDIRGRESLLQWENVFSPFN